MNSSKKKIRCTCYGPIACGKEYVSPWEDVWISWKERRKTKRAALTVIGTEHTKSEYEMAQEHYEETGEAWWIDEASKNWPFPRGIEYFIFEGNNIYCNKQYINRNTTEEMIAAFLGMKIEHLKFEWKRPKFIIIPT